MSETAKVTAYWWLPIQEQQNGFLIKFYANHDAVENPVFKLYDKDIDPPAEEFKILAENFPGLWKEIKAAGVDTSPPRESLKFVSLRDGGQLNELKVPLEFIAGLNKNGNPFKRALWPETLAMWAGGASGAGSAGSAGEERVYQGFTEQHETVLDLVGQEVYEIAKSAVLTTDMLYDELEAKESDIQLNPTPDELLKMVFYQTSRTFDKVRGAMTLSVDKARQGLADDFQVIRDGELKNFSQDLADGYFLIDSREEARDILTTIGIQINKETLAEYEDVDRRLVVAEQVWLFADITKKYKKTPGQAVEAINGIFNEIPW